LTTRYSKNNFLKNKILLNKFLSQTATFVQKSQSFPKMSFFFLANKNINKNLIFSSKKTKKGVNWSFLGKEATFCWAQKENKVCQNKQTTFIMVVSKKKTRANNMNSSFFLKHQIKIVENRNFYQETKKNLKKKTQKKLQGCMNLVADLYCATINILPSSGQNLLIIKG
jgi:hypothetical protein